RTAAFLIFAGLPGVFWVFSGINYPERFLMLLFAAFILCFRQAVKTQKTLFFVLCGIMAAYSTYMKEPVFGIFCVFAISSLIFSPKMSEKEKKFYFFLLFNGFLFLVLYYIFAYRNHSSLYTSAFSSGFFSFAASFFRGEKLNAAVLLFSAYRFYAVAAKKERNSVFEDSLLFAASGYICSYIILGFTFAYYYAPSVLLAVPSAVREISLIGRIGGYEKYCRQAFAALFLVLAAANIPLEASNIAISYVERTTHMPFIRTLAAHQKSGGTLYWNLPGNLPLNSINPTVNGQRHIYNVFLDYVNKKYSAEKLPGQNENFVLFRNDSEINIKNDDILFMPLFIGKNGQPLPFSEEILEDARKKGFAPLKCDLIYVRIFMKKGSYLEPNWLLSV
ncbi:MAG: hypothetical protein J5706_03220, partial [Elusimicrobiales bacterium]|nr:hypothetical protein [Elusimicrobiales bacterium]